MNGRKIDNYILIRILEIAREELAKTNKLVWSQRDWELLVSNLENPPEPNLELKAAFKKFQANYI